jgi:hypothetical protein
MTFHPLDIISGNCIHPYSQALISVLANIDVEYKKKKIILIAFIGRDELNYT